MSSLAEVAASLDRRLASIAEYSLVQLRECKGPISLHSELVDGIRQDLGVVDSQLEELTLLAEDEDTESARQRALSSVEHYKRQTDSLRRQVREATLVSKRRVDSNNAASQREELFKSAGKTSASIKNAKVATSKDDELMSATANVTDGLRRTRQLMEQELEKSSMSAQMLERSSQTLTLTTNQYSSFSNLLQTSKNLITTLEKADHLDRLLITAALVFFLLVCLLIIKRRILDRGIRAASLVGKVAGGVGGVGKKGVKALLQEQVTAASSLLSASASVVTAAATSLAIASSSRQHASPVSIEPTPSATSASSILSDEVLPVTPEDIEPTATSMAVLAEPTFDALGEVTEPELVEEGESPLQSEDVVLLEDDELQAETPRMDSDDEADVPEEPAMYQEAVQHGHDEL